MKRGIKECPFYKLGEEMGSRSQRNDIILCPRVGDNLLAENERSRCWPGCGSDHILQTPAFWLTEEWNLPKNVTLLSYTSHCIQVNDGPLELLL